MKAWNIFQSVKQLKNGDCRNDECRFFALKKAVRRQIFFLSVIMYRLKENGRAAVILPDGFLFGTDNAKVAIKTKLFSEFNRIK